jgi:hypothetical protein
MALLAFEKTLKFTPLGYPVAPSGKLLPGETTVLISSSRVTRPIY